MKKKWKIVGGVIVVILLLFAGIQVYLQTHFEAIIKDRLRIETAELTKGLYSLDIGKLNIGILDGFLTLENVHLLPDTARFANLRQFDESFADSYVEIHIREVAFKGINLKRQKDFKRLDFSQIVIDRPDIKLVYKKSGRKPEETHPDSISLFKIISPVFDKIKVYEILIQDGRFESHLSYNNDTVDNIVESVRLRIENFVIDSTTRSQNELFYCKDFQFTLGNAHISLGKDYSLDVAKINVGVKDSVLGLEKIQLKSAYSKSAFAWKSKNHSDWMDLSIDSLYCTGVHFTDLIKHKNLTIDSIFIKNTNFSDYKNQKTVIQHHKMPLLYESLQRLSGKINIRRIKARNMNVIYEELSKTGTQPGMISFNRINLDCYGLTNIVSKPNQYYRILADSRIMDQGLINADFRIPVDSLNDHFEITGTMGPMSMLYFNKIIEPLANAKIKSGHINGLDFSIAGGKYGAHIDMELLYRDMKVSVLKEKDNQLVEWGIVSKVTNDLLLKNDNPDMGNEMPRRVSVRWERDPYHSTFNYLWKICFSGIVETVGITNEKKSQLTKLKNVWDQIKSIGHHKNEKHEESSH